MHRGDIDLARLTLLSPPFLHAMKCNVSRLENILINVKIEAFSAKRMHSRSNETAIEAESRLLPQLVCYAVCFHLCLGIPDSLFPPRYRTLFDCTRQSKQHHLVHRFVHLLNTVNYLTITFK